MASQKRPVRRSPQFIAKAQSLFPPGGSASGGASFETFEDLVLPGVEEQFRRQFDDLPVALDEVDSIRPVMTYAGPFFPPLVIYGILVTGEEVELIDIEIHDDYWRLIGEDPKD